MTAAVILARNMLSTICSPQSALRPISVCIFINIAVEYNTENSARSAAQYLNGGTFMAASRLIGDYPVIGI
ncbi:MAG: hypothetical protein IKI42_04780, partial [Clostridia bacterium]|nr:hypothetical protein [Clostridia bacterium]